MQGSQSGGTGAHLVDAIAQFPYSAVQVVDILGIGSHLIFYILQLPIVHRIRSVSTICYVGNFLSACIDAINSHGRPAGNGNTFIVYRSVPRFHTVYGNILLEAYSNTGTIHLCGNIGLIAKDSQCFRRFDFCSSSLIGSKGNRICFRRDFQRFSTAGSDGRAGAGAIPFFWYHFGNVCSRLIACTCNIGLDGILGAGGILFNLDTIAGNEINFRCRIFHSRFQLGNIDCIGSIQPSSHIGNLAGVGIITDRNSCPG